MKLKRVIYAAGGIALVLLLVAWLAPGGRADVSKVRIGFAGYEVVDGKRSLILIVTNGSSYQISQPDGHCHFIGVSSNGIMPDSLPYTIACGFGSPGWGSWQFKIPKIPSIAPGTTYRFAVPVDDGPYTWHVTVSFTTIPLKDRLPYIIGSRWPSSTNHAAISFSVSPPPIAPASSMSTPAQPDSEMNITRRNLNP